MLKPFALASRPLLSLAMACIAIIALTLHRAVPSRMDSLRTTMQDGDTAAISRFRKIHVTGIVLNLIQLVLLVRGITRVAFQVSTLQRPQRLNSAPAAPPAPRRRLRPAAPARRQSLQPSGSASFAPDP